MGSKPTHDEVTQEKWENYVRGLDKTSRFMPDHVMRTDQTIVAWDDVPVAIQKKILNGTMTEEDWNSDWEVRSSPVAREVEDIVSEALNELPLDNKYVGRNHVHVWRKEYRTCMIKGCGQVRLPNVKRD